MQTIEDVQKSGIAVVTGGLLNRLTRNQALITDLEKILSGTAREGLIGTLKGIAQREDARPWLGSISIPVLVISGKEDAIIPREKAIEVVTACSTAWWVELPELWTHADDGESRSHRAGHSQPGDHINREDGGNELITVAKLNQG